MNFRGISPYSNGITQERETRHFLPTFLLGVGGRFPAPDYDMALSVSLTDEKKSLRAARIDEFLKAGRILRRERESLTGRLSFSQTAVFGRFGRG